MGTETEMAVPSFQLPLLEHQTKNKKLSTQVRILWHLKAGFAHEDPFLGYTVVQEHVDGTGAGWGG